MGPTGSEGVGTRFLHVFRVSRKKAILGFCPPFSSNLPGSGLTMVNIEDEQARPLLVDSNDGETSGGIGDNSTKKPQTISTITIPDEYIGRVLVIALTASLGMAATAATTVYAYADIMCKDPLHCEEHE